MRSFCYTNPFTTSQAYGFEFVIKTLVGDKQVKRLRSFNIYRYLCSLLDSLSTLFLYSISLIIPNIVSGILFAFFSNNSLIVQIGINVVGSLCLLLCVLRCIPSKQLFREFKTDCNRVVSFSFIRTLPLYIPMLLIIVWNLRYVHLFPRAFSSILVSPIIEELVFRGYLCNVLSDRLNPILGMTFSSLCFSVLHLYSFSISDSFIIFINRVLYSFIGGVAFSCCMFQDGCLLSAILFHIINNLFSVVLSMIDFSDAVNRCLEVGIMIPLIWYSVKFLYVREEKQE